jgi:lysophosphatidate acyltransferase
MFGKFFLNQNLHNKKTVKILKCLFLEIWQISNKMSIVAKKSIFFLGGTFGIAAFLCGIIFINRCNSRKAGKAMNDAMIDLKKKQAKLWIFPEGTRRNTGEIHEFKKGAFHAAIHAQVPIIPVVYSSYKHVFDAEKKIFTAGEIVVNVLPEISTEGLTVNDIDKLIEKTRNAMIKVHKASVVKG